MKRILILMAIVAALLALPAAAMANPSEDGTTEAPSVTTTEAPSVTTTESPSVTTTEAPSVTVPADTSGSGSDTSTPSDPCASDPSASGCTTTCESTSTCGETTCESTSTCEEETCEDRGDCPEKTCEELNNCPEEPECQLADCTPELPVVDPPPTRGGGAALPFTGVEDSGMFMGFLLGIMALMGGALLYRFATLREALAGAGSGARAYASGFGAALSRVTREEPSDKDDDR